VDGVVDHALPVVQLYFKRILELETQVIRGGGRAVVLGGNRVGRV
jgi:hypothetical protein